MGTRINQCGLIYFWGGTGLQPPNTNVFLNGNLMCCSFKMQSRTLFVNIYIEHCSLNIDCLCHHYVTVLIIFDRCLISLREVKSHTAWCKSKSLPGCHHRQNNIKGFSLGVQTINIYMICKGNNDHNSNNTTTATSANNTIIKQLYWAARSKRLKLISISHVLIVQLNKEGRCGALDPLESTSWM